MSYQKTIEYLYGLQKFGLKLGLQNIERLTEILGRPERDFATVHVAGTNGKGSTSAITATILAGSGLKTGLYTSPHMVRFTERIRILERIAGLQYGGEPVFFPVNPQKLRGGFRKGEQNSLLRTCPPCSPGLPIRSYEIPEEEVIRITELIRANISSTDILLNPTFFEFVTALAFKYFSEQKIDSAVIEVGMGGRLDATNVITPLVSVITSISMDHREFLGDTLSKIAFEKAGIIKEGVPVVSAAQDKDALKVIMQKAAQMDSVLYVYNRDFKGTLREISPEGIIFDYEDDEFKFRDLFIPLTGIHQIENACLAIKASLLFCKTRGIGANQETLRDSLKNVYWPGRLELLKDRDSENLHILLDGAHNPQAAEALAISFKELYLKNYKRAIWILGIMADKDVVGIVKPFLSATRPQDIVIATAPQYPRALPPKKLEDLINNLLISMPNHLRGFTGEFVRIPPCSTITSTENIHDALRMAKEIAIRDPGKVLMIVTGSFYTVGEAKAFLGERESLRTLWEGYSSEEWKNGRAEERKLH